MIMKRKLVKQGMNALTLTLPSSWIKSNNLMPKDEVDLIEVDHSLIISTEKKQAVKEIAVDIRNIDVQSGMFSVYTGFMLNNTIGLEIGRSNQIFLGPSESTTLFYTTNKKIEDCKYYIQGTSEISYPENFTNFQDVNYTKRRTQYRNVTQYVDVTKTRTLERNITKFRNRIIYKLFKISL